VLSQQFAHLMRAHLAPGGVAYWNTTHSQAVVDTAASVFKHVVQYGNFVAASDAPLTLSRQQRSANLQRFKRDGASVLNPTGKGSQLYRHLLHIGLPELGPNSRRRVRPGGVITDDNMLVEYKNLKRRPIGISAWTDLTRTRPVQARRAWWPTLRRVFRF
jgi:hypothetical protein